MLLSPDSDGWTRNVALTKNNPGLNPANWLFDGSQIKGSTAIDLRRNVDHVKRKSLTEILNEPVGNLKGLKVVLGQSHLLSPSRLHIPLGPQADRSGVAVMGAMSISPSFQYASARSEFINLGFSFLCLLCGLFLASRSLSRARLILGGLMIISVIIWVNSQFMTYLGIGTTPSLQFSCFWIGIVILSAHRMNLFHMVSTFMKGDISPEEAWIWRSFENNSDPVLLVSGMGRIRRANEAADELGSQLDAEFVKRCLNNSENSKDEVVLTLRDGSQKIYNADWPSETIPILILKDVTDRRQEVENLWHQVITDALTGLLSSAGFERAMKEIGPGTQTTDYAMFYMDINSFKTLNDQYGRETGDLLLQNLAQRLQQGFGSAARVARLNGDEFGAILYGKYLPEQLRTFASQIEAMMASPVNIQIANTSVTIAIGYAQPYSQDETVQSVFHRAEQAMYHRKSAQKHKAA